MDVIEKKYPSMEIEKYVSLLKYKHDTISLLGTGGNASQNYPSDIDLFTKITTKETSEQAYSEFMDMIDEVLETPNMYFIEFKIQTVDGEKHKFQTIKELEDGFDFFDKYFVNNVDYCKFDFVLLINGLYVELSSIYVFNPEELDYDVLKKSLGDDMVELMDEGKYYKSLKRLFALYKLYEPPNRKKLIEISRLFNSDTGALYKTNSILKAIQLMQENYVNDEKIDKLNKYVFNNLGFDNYEDIDNIVKDYDNLINHEGLSFYKKYYPSFLKEKEVPKLFGGSINQSILINAIKQIDEIPSRWGAFNFTSKVLPAHMRNNKPVEYHHDNFVETGKAYQNKTIRYPTADDTISSIDKIIRANESGKNIYI